MLYIFRHTVILLFILCTAFSFTATYDSTELTPKPVYGKEARVVSYILDNRHYKKIQFNDSLSSVILDSYIDVLDNNKTYFIRSDIASFESYRYTLDDHTHEGNVDPAYAIYNVFQQRYVERMGEVKKLIEKAFDYSKDEYYETDRGDAFWAQSKEELDTIWRKIVKSQALSLKLAGKSGDGIKQELHKRYDRFNKNISQFNSEDVFSLYMNAITNAYDPHTDYLSPKMFALFKQSMSLSLEGIGARLQMENDYTKVVEVITGGPADKSGALHSEDLIIGVGQGGGGEMVDVIGWRLDEVVGLIKGPKGTTVRLAIIPAKIGINGPSQELIIVRDKIDLEDSAAKKKIIDYQTPNRTYKFGVISLPSFYMDFKAYQSGDPNYRSTTADVKKLIQELQKEHVDGIVMDLRNNGGGSLAEAIDLTGLFIMEGPVVQVKDVGNKIEVGRDNDRTIFYEGPMVVATNRFSASASEIFAGAIQDYHRGVIVGEPTYGKGTVQTVVDLSRFINDEDKVGQLKYTFQKFYRVTGSSTQNKGVIPDVMLPSAFDDGHYGERAYPNALSWDMITETPFKRVADVNEKIIKSLRGIYEHRVEYDSTLQKYINEVKDFKKRLGQTNISLNEEKREKEREALGKKKSTGSAPEEDSSLVKPPTDKLIELNDEFLRESILVLCDLIDKKTS